MSCGLPGKIPGSGPLDNEAFHGLACDGLACDGLACMSWPGLHVMAWPDGGLD